MTVCFGLSSPDEWTIGWGGDWISWSPSIVDASGGQCAIRDRIIRLCSAITQSSYGCLIMEMRTGSMEGLSVGKVLGRPDGSLNFYWNRVNSINDNCYNYNRVITEHQSINQICAIVFIRTCIILPYMYCIISVLLFEKYTLIAYIFSSH